MWTYAKCSASRSAINMEKFETTTKGGLVHFCALFADVGSAQQALALVALSLLFKVINEQPRWLSATLAFVSRPHGPSVRPTTPSASRLPHTMAPDFPLQTDRCRKNILSSRWGRKQAGPFGERRSEIPNSKSSTYARMHVPERIHTGRARPE